MRNIPFVDREKELESLKGLKSKDFFMVVRGRRRIGKTTLLRKAFPEAVYIFVWPNKSYQWVVNEICTEQNIPKFSNFGDIIRYLLDKRKTIVLDEFQNFLNIDKSVFGEMQKLIDERKIKNESVNILISGSSYSLINKIFNAEASPLYGRRTHEIMLQELPLEKLFAALKIDIEEFIKIWSIFGGVPYYYTILEQGIPIEKIISNMIEKRDTMLLDEGKVILSVEFGKDSKTYNTILTAIAEGKTKLNEIATYFSNKKGETIKYIDILRKEFGLIKRMTPILSDPRKSREGLYEINDNLLSFWFYFIDKQRAYIEQERFDEVIAFFNENFPNYTGRKFERFIEYLIKKKILLPDFEFKKIGRQWGRIDKAEERKNQYEIDILGLDDKKRIMLLCECRWQEKIDAEKVLEELSLKALHVDAERKEEYFAVFAKSFSKKVKNYKEKPVFCFDLRDIERGIKSRYL